jgi:hypothetical protein
MEITMIVNGISAVHDERRGAALPTLGLVLRPRFGSADAPAVATFLGGSRGSAITPTPDPTLDVTSARTS